MKESRMKRETKHAAVRVAAEKERLAVANYTPEEQQIAELKKIEHDWLEDKMLEEIFGPNWLIEV
jgi:hypothetical protein